MAKKIVVLVEGGVVTSIYGSKSLKGVEVEVLDIDGVENDDIIDGFVEEMEEIY